MVERDGSALKQFLDGLLQAGVSDVATYVSQQPDLLSRCLSLVRVTALNAAAQALFETTSPDHIDDYSYIVDGGTFTGLARTILEDIASGAFTSREREGMIRTAQGNQRHVIARTTVVPGYEQTLARVVTAVIDITDQKVAAEALRASEIRFRELSLHDDLTGLYNTRHLYQALAELIVPHGPPCSAVFMDLDRFKHIVDTYGHLNGSRVIQEVGQTVQSCIRPPAFAVAYAGDEFVIVLPGATKREAVDVARTIQRRIESRSFLSAQGHDVRMTASLGIATYPDDATGMEDLLAVADQALFAAKASGRNGIVAAGAPAAVNGAAEPPE
jgi:diguanylate cyclase (GGDEF)-like protein